jgi:Kae1-associated kinase Bud32
MGKLIGDGAEAIVTRNNSIVTKNRLKKSYRHKKIDSQLRKSRTNREFKILKSLEKLDIAPKVLDIKDSILQMEFIDGVQVKKLLDKDVSLAKLIGKNLSLMHNLNIIHGDLTTSNMILSNANSNVKNSSVKKSSKIKKLIFIDFGLSFISARVEDKAVDIHVFKQALESKHYKVYNKAYSEFIKGYNPKDKKEVLERLHIVEQRGRYKEKT